MSSDARVRVRVSESLCCLESRTRWKMGAPGGSLGHLARVNGCQSISVLAKTETWKEIF